VSGLENHRITPNSRGLLLTLTPFRIWKRRISTGWWRESQTPRGEVGMPASIGLGPSDPNRTCVEGACFCCIVLTASFTGPITGY
jgi:hypothetical protein